MREKQKMMYQKIKKYDVITDDISNPKSKVYIVIDILGVTNNGSIDTIVMPICKVKHLQYGTGYYICFDLKKKLIKNMRCKDIFIDDIDIIGSIYPDDIPFIMDYKYTKEFDDDYHYEPPFCFIDAKEPDDDTLGGDDEMERYEIIDMITSAGEAKEFLEMYQALPRDAVMNIYGMNSDELNYAVEILKKRYNHRNKYPVDISSIPMRKPKKKK